MKKQLSFYPNPDAVSFPDSPLFFAIEQRDMFQYLPGSPVTEMTAPIVISTLFPDDFATVR